MDVDSGPVLAGHGFAACAFGVGAARANGRFDRAWPLAAEMLVTCWPLLDNTLAGPRILSNAVDAPYLGEAGVLFVLTRRPAGPTTTAAAGGLPGFACIVLAVYALVGVVPPILAVRGLRRWRRQAARQRIPLPRVQTAVWAVLVGGGLVAAAVAAVRIGLFALLFAQLLPRRSRAVTERLSADTGRRSSAPSTSP